MRVIGLDVSRTVAEGAYLERETLQAGGRVELASPALQRFAKGLRRTDEVVLEATGNTAAIVAALKPYVAKVVVANPPQVRLIAEARVKTDKIDAAILAQLYASGFLPEVWVPASDTQALRRGVARRSQLVRQRVIVHSDQGTHPIRQRGQDALLAFKRSRPQHERARQLPGQRIAESFFSSLKKERIQKRIYKTRDLTRADIFDYTKVFYHRTPRHSHLDGVSPEAFEPASA